MKKMVFAVLFIVISFVACNDDETTTMAEDKESVQIALLGINSVLDDYNSGIVNDLAEFSKLERNEKKFASSLFGQLAQTFDSAKETDSEAVRFDKSRYVGKYTFSYDEAKDSTYWKKEPYPSILFLFPTSTDFNPLKNNAELGITNYANELLLVSGTSSSLDSLYVPGTAKAYLKIDNKEKLKLDWSASCAKNMLTKLNTTLFADPYTAKVKFVQKTLADYNFTFTLNDKNLSNNDFTVDGDMLYTKGLDTMDQLLEVKSYLKAVKLSVKRGKLTINANIDVLLLNEIDEKTVEEYNEIYKIDVLLNGKAYAKIVFKEAEYDVVTKGYSPKISPFLVYTDNTEEDAQKVFRDFMIRCESTFSEIQKTLLR